MTGSIRVLLDESAARSPDKTLYVFRDQEVSYDAFRRTVTRVANGLLSLGIKHGDKVAILLPNCLEFPYTWLAANIIGAVMVPVNARFVDEEIRYVLHHSEANLLITCESHLDTVGRIRKALLHMDLRSRTRGNLLAPRRF